MYSFKEEIKGLELEFQTNKEVFSPGQIDIGTRSMLEFVDFNENDKVLDLGCGYGVVGILAAKIIGPENVVMCDIQEEAVELARKNAEINNVNDVKIVKSDGLENIDDKNFTIILSNPPYHADFSVAKLFIEKGFNRLKIGGKMFMVTKRKKWYKNKLIAIFGGVRIRELNGYYIFMAEKRNSKYANKK
ncbi:class I SAM-dependent methyltransferase [Natronospora cellulosivora (SeqCode)]